MTKEVYRALSFKASLVLLASNPLNLVKKGCNVTLPKEVYRVLSFKASLGKLASNPLNPVKKGMQRHVAQRGLSCLILSSESCLARI